MNYHQLDKSYSSISYVKQCFKKKKKRFRKMVNRRFGILFAFVVTLATQSHSRHIRLGNVRSMETTEMDIGLPNDDCVILTDKMGSTLTFPPERVTIYRAMTNNFTPIMPEEKDLMDNVQMAKAVNERDHRGLSSLLKLSPLRIL